jgi:preprotein translocase SecE subunit
MAFIQYLKDTRGELNHVAWPTRVQTVIFTILVIVVSILVSLYLGFFDFLFTTGLGKIVDTLPGAAPAIQAEEPQIEFTPVEAPTETPAN